MSAFLARYHAMIVALSLGLLFADVACVAFKIWSL
jgi:hypothetical protein